MQRDMRIRNRTVLLLLLPVTIFLFATGWILNCFGDRTHTRPPERKQAPTKEDGIQIHVATVQESQQYNE